MTGEAMPGCTFFHACVQSRGLPVLRRAVGVHGDGKGFRLDTHK